MCQVSAEWTRPGFAGGLDLPPNLYIFLSYFPRASDVFNTLQCFFRGKMVGAKQRLRPHQASFAA